MKENKKIQSFKTPEKYFENLEERLLVKISEESFPKTAGHIVPEGYFDKIEEQVFNTVIDLRKTKKVIPLFTKKHFGYAAAIAACLILGFSIFNSSTPKSTLDTIQLAAIDNYIEEGNLNMDLYDLTSFIDDADIKEVNFENKQLSDNAMESYILENVDEETLINEQ